MFAGKGLSISQGQYQKISCGLRWLFLQKTGQTHSSGCASYAGIRAARAVGDDSDVSEPFLKHSISSRQWSVQAPAQTTSVGFVWDTALLSPDFPPGPWGLHSAVRQTDKGIGGFAFLVRLLQLCTRRPRPAWHLWEPSASEECTLRVPNTFSNLPKMTYIGTEEWEERVSV